MCHSWGIVLAFVSSSTLFAQGQPGAEIDQKTVKAWQAAGARVGWASELEFHTWKFSQNKPNGHALPVIYWENLAPGRIAVLPAPTVPFVFVARDEGLKENAEINNLHGLGLNGTKIGRAGFKAIGAAKNLRILNLAASSVTDDDLKELANLKNLENLNLGATGVSVAGMKTIGGFEKLQTLYLDSTDTADAGLKEIARLKNLRKLNLIHTNVTDSGLKEIGRLKSLQELYLNITPITDAGLKELTGLTGLQKLGVSTTKITDEGLKEIARLEGLKYVDLNGTKTTETGKAQLRKQRPGLEVYPP